MYIHIFLHIVSITWYTFMLSTTSPHFHRLRPGSVVHLASTEENGFREDGEALQRSQRSCPWRDGKTMGKTGGEPWENMEKPWENMGIRNGFGHVCGTPYTWWVNIKYIHEFPCTPGEYYGFMEILRIHCSAPHHPQPLERNLEFLRGAVQLFFSSRSITLVKYIPA